MEFLSFLKEHRPKLLSYGGAMTLLAWAYFILSENLCSFYKYLHYGILVLE